MYDPMRVAVHAPALAVCSTLSAKQTFYPSAVQSLRPKCWPARGVKKQLEDTIYKSLEAHMAPGASGDMSFDNSTNNIIVSRVTYS